MLNTLTTQWEMSVKAADKREKVLEAERVKQWNQQQLNAPTMPTLIIYEVFMLSKKLF